MLHANVVCLDTFGRARGIRHLILRIPGVDCTRITSTVSALKQLQTMWLADTNSRVRTSGILQLDALSSLQSLALDGVVPDSIHLHASCKLHLRFDQWGIIQTVWDTVLPNLRSVKLSDSSCVIRSLPSMLRKADNLVRAAVLCKQFGSESAPLLLHGALAGVRALVVHSTDLHVVVPPNVLWRHVSLEAKRMLGLRFESLPSFVEHIPSFCFRCRYLVHPVCPGSLCFRTAAPWSLPPNCTLCGTGFTAVTCSYPGTEVSGVERAFFSRWQHRRHVLPYGTASLRRSPPFQCLLLPSLLHVPCPCRHLAVP